MDSFTTPHRHNGSLALQAFLRAQKNAISIEPENVYFGSDHFESSLDVKKVMRNLSNQKLGLDDDISAISVKSTLSNDYMGPYLDHSRVIFDSSGRNRHHPNIPSAKDANEFTGLQGKPDKIGSDAVVRGDRLRTTLQKLRQQRLALVFDKIWRVRLIKQYSRAFSRLQKLGESDYDRQVARTSLANLVRMSRKLMTCKKLRYFQRWFCWMQISVAHEDSRALTVGEALNRSNKLRCFQKLARNMMNSRRRSSSLLVINTILRRYRRRRSFFYWRSYTNHIHNREKFLKSILLRYTIGSVYTISLLVQRMWWHWKLLSHAEHRRAVLSYFPSVKLRKEKLSKAFSHWSAARKRRINRAALFRSFLDSRRYKMLSSAWKVLCQWRKDIIDRELAARSFAYLLCARRRLRLTRAIRTWARHCAELEQVRVFDDLGLQVRHWQLRERDARGSALFQALRLIDRHRTKLSLTHHFARWRLHSSCLCYESSLAQLQSEHMETKHSRERYRWLKALLWKWYLGTAAGALQLWRAHVRQQVQLERACKVITCNITGRTLRNVLHYWTRLTNQKLLSRLRDRSRFIAARKLVRHYFRARVISCLRTWYTIMSLYRLRHRCLSMITTRLKSRISSDAFSVWHINSLRSICNELRDASDLVKEKLNRLIDNTQHQERLRALRVSLWGWTQSLASRKAGVRRVVNIAVRVARKDTKSALQRWLWAVNRGHICRLSLRKLETMLTVAIRAAVLKSFRKWFTSTVRTGLWDSRQAFANLKYEHDQILRESEDVHQQLDIVLNESKNTANVNGVISTQVQAMQRWILAAQRSILRGILIRFLVHRKRIAIKAWHHKTILVRMEEAQADRESELLKRSAFMAIKSETTHTRQRLSKLGRLVRGITTKWLLSAFKRWNLFAIRRLLQVIESSQVVAAATVRRSQSLVTAARPCVLQWISLVRRKRNLRQMLLRHASCRVRIQISRAFCSLRGDRRSHSVVRSAIKHVESRALQVAISVFKNLLQIRRNRSRALRCRSELCNRRVRMYLRLWLAKFTRRMAVRRALRSMCRIYRSKLQQACLWAIRQWRHVTASDKLLRLTAETSISQSAMQCRLVINEVLGLALDPSKTLHTIISECVSALQGALGVYDMRIYIRKGDTLVASSGTCSPASGHTVGTSHAQSILMVDTSVASDWTPSPSHVAEDGDSIAGPLSSPKSAEAVVVSVGEGWVGASALTGVAAALEVHDVHPKTGTATNGLRTFQGKLRDGRSPMTVPPNVLRSLSSIYSDAKVSAPVTRARYAVLPLLHTNDVCGVMEVLMAPAGSTLSPNLRLKDVITESAQSLFETASALSSPDPSSSSIAHALQLFNHLKMSDQATQTFILGLVVLSELVQLEVRGADRRLEPQLASDAEKARLQAVSKDLREAEQQARDRIDHLEKSRAKYFSLCKQYKQELDELQAHQEVVVKELALAEDKLGLLKEQRMDVEHLHEVMRLVTINALEEDERTSQT